MKYENFISVFLLSLIYIFLLSYFKPNLILSTTLTNGGDTGSHLYPFFYMKDYLLPELKLIGWSPGWYAGIPMFQFYFPLLFFIMSVLSFLIPASVSFKIGTILGTFLLPLTTFLAMKVLRFKFPMPILASIITLVFLFNEGNSMWGGNIPSTLAGEFSESFSLALSILYLSILYIAVTENNKKFLLISPILFTLVLLSHIITALIIFLSSAFLLFFGNIKENFKKLFFIYFISFLLSSFWTLPLLFKLEYTTPFFVKWYFSDFIKEMFPNIFLPFLFLSTLGIVLALKIKEKRIFYILTPIIPSIPLFYLSPYLGIVDIRFLPFIQLFLLFPSSYLLSNLKFKNIGILTIVFSILILAWVKINTTYIHHWIEWNYSGFESKGLWNVYSSINSFLKGNVSSPRVIYEHTPLNEKLGTIRAFELLPLLSGRPTLEGLYFQSITTVPFVFYIQSLTSLTPSCPFPEWRCTFFNLTKASKYLKLFNVEYYIVRSEDVKKEVEKNILYEKVFSFEQYEIYKVLENDNRYVFVPSYYPVYIETKDWKKSFYYEWFSNEELIDIPLVIERNNFPKAERIDILPKIKVDNNCKIEEEILEEKITFTTNCTGKPHIIKISYFPNWNVKGADKIFLVSPSFMLVFPKEEKVEIYYENILIDNIGILLSLIGIFIIFFILLKNLRKGKLMKEVERKK